MSSIEVLPKSEEAVPAETIKMSGIQVLPKSEEAVPVEAPSPLELKIINQIEYLFGDFNLSRGQFFGQQVKRNDGWVYLETVIKYKKLRKLSKDFNVIVAALKKSPKQLMEVSKDCTKIRRRTAVPVFKDYFERQKEFEKKTVYVKGFERTSSRDVLLEFFKDYNVVNISNIRNRKPFQTSAFVTFETREEAERFLESKEIKYNGVDLLKAWNEKEMLQKEQELAKEQEECKRAAENEMVPGCLLKIDLLNKDTTREQIQEVFELYGTISCIDYSKGKPTAVLKFERGQTKSVLEKVLKDGETIKIGSSKATVTVIEGEEAKEYWKNIDIWWRAQTRKYNKSNNREESSEPSQKQTKIEAFERNDEKDSTAEPPQKKMKVKVNDSNAMEVNTDASSEQKKAEVEPQQQS